MNWTFLISFLMLCILLFLAIFVYLILQKPCNDPKSNEIIESLKVSAIISAFVVVLFLLFHVLYQKASWKIILIRIVLAFIWSLTVCFVYILESKLVIHPEVCPLDPKHAILQSIILTALILCGVGLVLLIEDSHLTVDQPSSGNGIVNQPQEIPQISSSSLQNQILLEPLSPKTLEPLQTTTSVQYSPPTPTSLSSLSSTSSPISQQASVSKPSSLDSSSIISSSSSSPPSSSSSPPPSSSSSPPISSPYSNLTKSASSSSLDSSGSSITSSSPSLDSSGSSITSSSSSPSLDSSSSTSD